MDEIKEENRGSTHTNGRGRGEERTSMNEGKEKGNKENAKININHS